MMQLIYSLFVLWLNSWVVRDGKSTEAYTKVKEMKLVYIILLTWLIRLRYTRVMLSELVNSFSFSELISKKDSVKKHSKSHFYNQFW